MVLHHRVRMPENIEYPKGKPPRVRIVVPDRLQEAVGKITGQNRKVVNLRESVGTYDPVEIKRRVAEIKAKFVAIIEAAEQMVCPPVVVTLPARRFARGEAIRVHRLVGQSALGHALAVLYGEQQVTVSEADPLARGVGVDSPENVVPLDRAAAAKPADAHVVIDYLAVIDEWAKERQKDQKAREQLASKLLRFFSWLDTGEFPKPRAKFAPPRHTDMNRVRADDLRGFRRELVDLMDGGKIQDTTVNDWIDMLVTIFRFGHEDHTPPLDINPAAKLHRVPINETEERTADPFTRSEIKRIIAAALASADPRIKWPYLLAATNGPRLAEIVEASTADVYQDEETGLWCFDIRLENRPSGQRIKNAVSKRKLPLVKLVRDAGFVEYVQGVRRDHYGGGDGPLFPQFDLDRYGRLNTDANKVLMGWLRNEMQIKHPRKRFHGWRKTLSILLERHGSSADRARFVVGHLPRDVHAKHYLDHPLPDVLASLEAVPDSRTTHPIEPGSAEG